MRLEMLPRLVEAGDKLAAAARQSARRDARVR